MSFDSQNYTLDGGAVSGSSVEKPLRAVSKESSFVFFFKYNKIKKKRKLDPSLAVRREHYLVQMETESMKELFWFIRSSPKLISFLTISIDFWFQKFEVQHL